MRAVLDLQRLAGNRATAGLVAVQRSGSIPAGGSPGREGHQPGGPAGAGITPGVRIVNDSAQSVQRQDAAPASALVSENDPRLDDPGFLICLAFCYLGVPPSAFKDLMQGMLECLSAEMRAADSANYEANFAAAREELAGYSKVRLLGKIFRFLMHGELGPMGVIRVTARTAPIRDRIIARLLAMGATHAGLLAAEAVVRKVLLVIDAVIVAGCATYCGAVQVGRAVVELTEAVAQGIASAMQVLSGIGDAVAGVLIDAVLSIYGQANPSNWVLNPALPAQTRADLGVLGMSLWAQVRPGSPWTTRRPGQTDADQLLANAGRTLAAYRVPRELMVSVAASLQRTITAGGGSATVSADQLMEMSYIGLIAFLRDNGLMSFRADPIAFAHSELDAAP